MPSELSIKIAELRGKIVGNDNGTWYADWDKLPEPDTNPADCLDLIRYMLSKHATVTIDTFSQRNEPGFVVWIQFDKQYKGEADTLEQSVSRAALAALQAGQEDNG